jgi:hypothetical protein
MINPRRASEIGGPLGIVESDISEIGRAAIVARIVRITQLALPVLTAIIGILVGKYYYPLSQSSGGYPLSIAIMAAPSSVMARRGSWKGTSILAAIGFILGFASWTIYSITRPDPPVLLYGVYSK